MRGNKYLPKIFLIGAFALAFFVSTFLIFVAEAQAATKTVAANGNWGTAGTWSPSGVPVTGDAVIITGIVSIAANVTAFPATVRVGSPETSKSGTLRFYGGSRTMTVTTDVSVTNLGTWEVVNASSVNTSTLTIGRNLTVVSGGKFNMVSTSDDVCNVTFSNSSPKIGGGGSIIFHSLTLIAGTPSLTSDASAIPNPVAPVSAGVVTLPTGCTFNLNSNNLTLTSTGTALSLTGTATLSGTGTVTFNASTGTQTVPAITYYNLTFSNAAAKNLASGTVNIGGGWSVTSGTADASANNSSVTVAGDITGTGPIKSGSGTISLAGNWANSGTFTCGTGRVNYNNTAGGQTVGGLTYNHLSLSNTSGTDTAAANITVNGALTTEAGGTLDLTNAYRLLGTLTAITNNGCIKTSVPTATSSVPLAAGETWSGNGTVEYAAATAQSIVKGTYHDLTFSGAGAKTITSETVTVGGDWSVTSGTADASVNNSSVDVTGNLTGTGPVKFGTGTLYLAGNWTNSGAFTCGTGTVSLDGTSQQTINKSATFYNLTLTNSSGTDDPGDGVSFTPGIIFSTSETVSNNYTITTPSVRVQYNSGSTYTFNNINWDGGAASTNIFFRNSSLSSGSWLLDVSGTQTAVSFVNVARSDASSGSAINANDGTCYDAQNNINWFWGANPNFFNVF